MARCVNIEHPFFKKYSETTGISKDSIKMAANLLAGIGVDFTDKNEIAYKNFLNAYFNVDEASSKMLFDWEAVKNNPEYKGKNQDALEADLNSIKDDIDKFNESKKQVLSEETQLRIRAGKYFDGRVKTVTTNTGKRKLIIPAFEVGSSTVQKFQDECKRIVEKRNAAFQSSSELDSVANILDGLKIKNEELIRESPDFLQDHIYYRKLEKGEKRDNAVQIAQWGDDYWVPVDTSVSKLAKENAEDETKYPLYRDVAGILGTEHDTIARLVFMSEKDHRQENRDAAKERLKVLQRKGTDNFSADSVKIIIQNMQKVIKSLDKKFAGKEWRAFAQAFPMVAKYSDGKTTQYVAGEFDLLLYDSDGNIYMYDFKTEKSELANPNDSVFLNNSNKRRQYARQTQHYMNILQVSCPELIGRFKENAHLIVSKISYKPINTDINKKGYKEDNAAITMYDEGKNPLIKMNESLSGVEMYWTDPNTDKEYSLKDIVHPEKTNPRAVKFGNSDMVLEAKPEEDKISAWDFFSIEDDVSGGIVINNKMFNPKSLKFNNRLQVERTRLYNSKDDIPQEEVMFIARTVAARLTAAINEELEKNPSHKGNRASALSNVRDEVLDYVFGVMLAYNSMDDQTFILKKNILRDNQFALLEFADHFFIRNEGFSIFSSGEIDYDDNTSNNPDQNDTVSKEMGAEEEMRREDPWMLGDANRQSPNLTLSKELKRIFVTFNTHKNNRYGYSYINENGEREYIQEEIDSQTAFNFLRPLLSKCTSLEEMKGILETVPEDVLSDHPYINDLLEHLKQTKENYKFRAAFFNAFRMQNIVYSATRMELDADGVYRQKTYFVNTSDVETAMQTQMRYIYRKGSSMLGADVTADYLEGELAYLNKHFNSSSKSGFSSESLLHLATLMEKLGFASKVVTRDHLLQVLTVLNKLKLSDYSVKKIKKSLTDPNYGFIPKVIEYLRSIEQNRLNPSVETIDIFSREDREHNAYSGMMGVIRVIAPFVDQAVESSCYENGKTYYSFSAPSYLSDLCDITQNPDRKKVLKYLEDEFMQYNYFARPNPNDPAKREILNPILKDIYENGKFLRYKVQLHSNGTEYENLRKGSYALSMLTEFYGKNKGEFEEDESDVWYASPILANKGTAEYIKGRAYLEKDFKSRITEQIENTFEQEIIQIKQVLARAMDVNVAPVDQYDIQYKEDKDVKKFLEKMQKGELTVSDMKELFSNPNFTKSGANFSFLTFLNSTEDENILAYIAAQLNCEGIHNSNLSPSEAKSRLNEESSKVGELSADAKEAVKEEFAAFMEESFKNYKQELKDNGLFSTRQRTVKGQKLDVFQYLEDFTGTSTVDMFKEGEMTAEEVKEEMERKIDGALEKFFWNHVFFQINFIQLTSTSLAFYKNMEEFQKRNGYQQHSPKQKYDVSAYIYTVDGTKIDVSDGTRRSVIIEDDQFVKSELILQLTVMFNRKIEAAATEEEKDRLREKKDFIVGMFKKINTTDGEAFIGPSTYRKEIAMEGGWDDAKERAYENLIDNGVVDRDQKFQVRKNFGYGRVRNSNVRIMQQYKNSEYCLILADAMFREEGIRNKLTAIFDFLENSSYSGRTVVRARKVYKDGEYLREAKENEKDGQILERGTYKNDGVDAVCFKSNVKSGARAAIDLNNVAGYEGALSALHSAVKNNYSETVQEMDYSCIGKQQPVPYHFMDGNMLVGSQQRILSMSGIDPNVTFDKFALSLAMGKHISEHPVAKKGTTFAEVSDEYQELVAEGINQSLKALENELLINPEGRRNLIRAKIRKLKKFADIRGKDPAFKEFVNKDLVSLEEKKVITTDMARTIRTVAMKHLMKSKFTVKDIMEDSDLAEIVAPISENDNKSRNAVLSEIIKDYIMKDVKFGVDLLEAVEIDEETGEFKVPLAENMQSVRIQQLLNSICRDRIWKQKSPGGSVVQVTGWDSNLHMVFVNDKGEVAKYRDEFPDGKEGDKQYLKHLEEGNFRFNHYEAYAPCPTQEVQDALAAATAASFKSGKNINYFQNVDAAIEAGIITEEMLKLIGYRIPTEDKYSMFPIKIVGFVSMGESIILPREITTIAGLDFDVDKLYLMRKHFYAASQGDSLNELAAIKFLKSIGVTDSTKQNIIIGKVKGMLKKRQIDENEFNNLEENPTDSTSENYDYDKDTLEGKLMTEVLSNESLYLEKKFVHMAYDNEDKADIKRNFRKRQNRIFDLQWAVLTNRETSYKMFNPQNFEYQKRIGYIITLLKTGEYSYNELQEMSSDELKELAGNNVRDIILPQTSMHFQEANMSANTLVGVFANNVVSHAFLSLPNVGVSYRPTTPFEINGHRIDPGHKLDALVGFDGEDIAKYVASYLGAAVDAAKSNALAPIHINNITANPAMLLIRLGFNVEEVSLFMSQPIIEKVITKYNEEMMSGYARIDNVIDEYIKENKLESSITKIVKGSKDEQYIGSGDEKFFTNEKFASEIKNNDVNSEIQLRVLLLFRDLLNDAQDMGQITFATKFNSRSNSTGPRMSDTFVLQSKVESYEKSLHDPKSGFKFTGTDVLTEIPIVKAFYDASLGKYENGRGEIVKQGYVHSLMSRYFPHLSNKFKGVVRLIEGEAMVEKLNAEDVERIYNQYVYYLLTKNIFNTNPERLTYLLREFPGKIWEYFRDRVDSLNLVKGALYMEYDQQGFPAETLQMRTAKMSGETEEKFKNDWMALVKEEPELMHELVEYMLIINAFGFSPKSGLHQVPAEYKFMIEAFNGSDKTYLESIADITMNPDQYMDQGKEFKDLFFRNNSFNPRYVKKLRTAEDGRFILNEKTGKLLPRDNNTIIYDWVRIGEDNLFKAVKTSDGKFQYYVKVEPLGKENTILEYNANSEGRSDDEALTRESVIPRGTLRQPELNTAVTLAEKALDLMEGGRELSVSDDQLLRDIVYRMSWDFDVRHSSEVKFSDAQMINTFNKFMKLSKDDMEKLLEELKAIKEKFC